jgi:hypothetical protein
LGGGGGGPPPLGACRSNTAGIQTEAYCSAAHTRPEGQLRRACGRNGSLNLPHMRAFLQAQFQGKDAVSHFGKIKRLE